MLRVYAEWKAADRRTAVDNIKAHGCYRPGIPLLIDSTEVAPDVLSDVRVLRAAMASALPESRIAIVVNPAAGLPDEALTQAAPVFTARADALRWLTAP